MELVFALIIACIVLIGMVIYSAKLKDQKVELKKKNERLEESVNLQKGQVVFYKTNCDKLEESVKAQKDRMAKIGVFRNSKGQMQSVD